MITITEALAEIKLIKNKIISKETFIQNNCTKRNIDRDEYEKEGGIQIKVKNEIKAVSDLYLRLLTIRTAIQEVNFRTTLEINNTKQSVASWIVWKREVYPIQLSFLREVLNKCQREIREGNSRPQVITAKDGVTPELITVNACVDISKLQESVEKLTSLYDKLDGKLSLINATTTVEV